MTYKHQCTCTKTDLAADPCRHSDTSEGCYVHDPQLADEVEAFAAAVRAHELAAEAWNAANTARHAAEAEMRKAHRERVAASELASTCYYCGRPADDRHIVERVRCCADNEGCARDDYDEADDEADDEASATGQAEGHQCSPIGEPYEHACTCELDADRCYLHSPALAASYAKWLHHRTVHNTLAASWSPSDELEVADFDELEALEVAAFDRRSESADEAQVCIDCGRPSPDTAWCVERGWPGERRTVAQ